MSDRQLDILSIGFRSDDHIRSLLEQASPSGFVAVIVLNSVHFDRLRARGEISSLLRHPRLRIICGSSTKISRTLQELAISDTCRIHYDERSLQAPDPELREIVAAIQRVRASRHRAQVTSAQIVANIRENLKWVRNSSGLDCFRETLHGQPAILVAAGPSLDTSFSALRSAQDRVYILAVDTVCRALLRNGIRPTLMLSTDPKRQSLEHFSDTDPQIPLAYLPSVYPKILDRHCGHKIVAWPASDPAALAMNRRWPKGCVESAGTVAFFALEVALRLGASPIIFVGLDLAFHHSKRHCTGAQAPRYLGRTLQVAGTFGEPVLTTPLLDGYRHAIEGRITQVLLQQRSHEFINTSATGARIRNTTTLSLESVLARYIRQPSPASLSDIFSLTSPPAPPRLSEEWAQTWDQLIGGASEA